MDDKQRRDIICGRLDKALAKFEAATNGTSLSLDDWHKYSQVVKNLMCCIRDGNEEMRASVTVAKTVPIEMTHTNKSTGKQVSKSTESTNGADIDLNKLYCDFVKSRRAYEESETLADMRAMGKAIECFVDEWMSVACMVYKNAKYPIERKCIEHAVERLRRL